MNSMVQSLLNYLPIQANISCSVLNSNFFFYANHLNGHIPISLSNLSNLDNQLSSSIPPEILKAPQFS